jgi:hypothetical protein
MMFGAAAPMLVSLLGDMPELSADEKIDRYLLLKDIDRDLRSLSPAEQQQVGNVLMGGEYMGDYADLLQKIGKLGKGALKGISKAVKAKKAKKKAAKAKKSKLAATADKVAAFVRSGMSPTEAQAAAVGTAPVVPVKKPMAVWILPAAVGAVALVGVFAFMGKGR